MLNVKEIAKMAHIFFHKSGAVFMDVQRAVV